MMGIIRPTKNASDTSPICRCGKLLEVTEEMKASNFCMWCFVSKCRHWVVLSIQGSPKRRPSIEIVLHGGNICMGNVARMTT